MIVATDLRSVPAGRKTRVVRSEVLICIVPVSFASKSVSISNTI